MLLDEPFSGIDPIQVLELQRTKRDLADAIITGNNSLLQNLTREDLQLLLS